MSASSTGIEGKKGTPTGIVKNSSFRPEFDNHGQWADAFVNLHVRPDHACVLQSQGIIDIHVTCKSEFRVPDFHDGNFRVGNTYDAFHAVCPDVSSQSLNERGISLRLARTSANKHTCSNSFEVVVIQMSTNSVSESARKNNSNTIGIRPTYRPSHLSTIYSLTSQKRAP